MKSSLLATKSVSQFKLMSTAFFLVGLTANPQSCVKKRYSFFRICSCLLLSEDKILFSKDGFGLVQVALAFRQDILALEQRCASHVSQYPHLIGSHL